MQIRVQEMQSRGNMDTMRRMKRPFLYVQIGMKKGFVVGTQREIDIIEKSNRLDFVKIDRRKESLYKQAMSMQMGRVPKQYTEYTTVQRGMVLEMPTGNIGYTTIWQVCG